MNITKGIGHFSVVVQWDLMDHILPTIYTVAWTSISRHSLVNLIEQSSYTITG